MSVIFPLVTAAYGIHLADQIALVAVPLIAAFVFDASPQVIGMLVASQSVAHLVGTLPFGVLADQRQLRSLVIASAMMSLAGSAIAVVSIISNGLVLFGVGITIAGFGVVLFVLTALSILPRIADKTALAAANAKVEFPRSLCSFAVPLTLGLLVSDVSGGTLFAVACFGSIWALVFSLSLPKFERASKPKIPVLLQVLEGGHFVLRHSLLRPIALCAVFWNLAFAVLFVIIVPVIKDIYLFDPGAFGIAMASFGLAAVAGTWLAGHLAQRLPPSVLLVFGPGSSVLAVAGLLLIGPDSSEAWLYICFFFISFGPAMWQVVQNSVRQLVAPPGLLGRVNAVIQTAIYGVRPLGALIGGVVANSQGLTVALVLAVAGFILSFGVALISKMRRVRSFSELEAVV
ncbi:MAG: MFS transporter [Pseudomonadota bacterium]